MITFNAKRLDSDVEQLLRIKKRTAEKRGRKMKISKPPRLIFPIGIEREYVKMLKKIVKQAREVVRVNVINQMPGILNEIRELNPTLDSNNLKRKDAKTPTEKLAELFVKSRAIMGNEIPDKDIMALAERYASMVSTFNKSQINKAFRQTLGVDVIGSEPYLRDMLMGFVQENVNLIKDIPAKTASEIELLTMREGRAGTRHEEIAKKINERFGVAESRAELIARDQIGKLNGQLTQLRQTQTGVKKYIWRTSLDERVREEHEEREGEVFEWDDPPTDGHPGEPVSCRCWAEPVLEDLVE